MPKDTRDVADVNSDPATAATGLPWGRARLL